MNNTAITFAELLAKYSPTAAAARQIVVGTYLGKGLVSVDGSKCDAQLPKFERLHAEPPVGFRAEVLLIDPSQQDESDPFEEEGKGLLASFAQAKDWLAVQRAAQNNERVIGKLVHKRSMRGGVFGGYKVRVGSITGFIFGPELRGVHGAQDMLGREVWLEVKECDIAANKLQFSMRWTGEARRMRLELVQPGELLEGTVTKHLDFGMLVDIGDGATGLVHHSEMIKNCTPAIGQHVPVVVCGKDAERGRVALSHRKGVRMTFAAADSAGKEVEGKVIALKQYGAFVELEPGVAGLVHRSRLSGDTELREGDLLRVRVLSFDAKGERIDLAVVR